MYKAAGGAAGGDTDAPGAEGAPAEEDDGVKVKEKKADEEEVVEGEVVDEEKEEK
jgi:hypothetical protein